mmetsp:Transcript_9772/g.17643  ORF Transcript_9772/g.17643 Transcript_9772/m.17643 type:complete len:210 (+) Transcript_9772:339-968(+)
MYASCPPFESAASKLCQALSYSAKLANLLSGTTGCGGLAVGAGAGFACGRLPPLAVGLEPPASALGGGVGGVLGRCCRPVHSALDGCGGTVLVGLLRLRTSSILWRHSASAASAAAWAACRSASSRMRRARSSSSNCWNSRAHRRSQAIQASSGATSRCLCDSPKDLLKSGTFTGAGLLLCDGHAGLSNKESAAARLTGEVGARPQVVR